MLNGPPGDRASTRAVAGAPGPSHLGTWESTNPMRANSEPLAPPQVVAGAPGPDFRTWETMLGFADNFPSFPHNEEKP
jgi:hypothetical protein